MEVGEDLFGRDAMNPPLGLAQQAKGSRGSVPYPVGERRLLDPGDQLADVPVRAVGMPVIGSVGMATRVIVLVDRLRRMLLHLTRQDHVHFGGAYAAANRRRDVDPHLRKPQSRGERAQPLGGRARRDEGSQQHVAADSRRRVEYGKTSVVHRLINMGQVSMGGKPGGTG